MILAATLAMGCGDPLVDGSFLGDPQATFAGTFSGTITGNSRPGSPHMGVVWFRVFNEQGETVHERLTEVTPIAESQFPWNFTFHVYDQPPVEALNLFQDPQNTGELTALGRADILVFDDVDRNGAFAFSAPRRLQPPDKIIGFATDYVLLWFDREVEPPEGVIINNLPVSNPGALTEGYHVVRLDECGQPVQLIEAPIPQITVELLSPTDRIPDRTAACP